MTERWQTPGWIFDPLNQEFQFQLDAAADAETTRCDNYLTDALNTDEWPASPVWMNPPYGSKIEPFVRKADEQARRFHMTIVALIPFRCRAAYWHECIIGRAVEVRCIRTRPRFVRVDGTVPKLTGTCDSCIVVWRGRGGYTTKLVSGPSP